MSVTPKFPPSGAQWLVCPCNSVGDFPQKCPYHTEDYWRIAEYWPQNTFEAPKRRESWTCHRCDAVNAPHVDRCDCRSTAYTVDYSHSTTTTITTYDDKTKSGHTPEVPSVCVSSFGGGSWIFCEHANECPMLCPCKPDCICRVEGSCKE